MGIPIISELWDGIRWVIDFFVNKTPKPIKIMFFLLSLIFLGTLISSILHLSGFHCTSNKEVVKVDTIDLTSNIKIWYITTRDSITGDTVDVTEALPNYNSITTLTECFLFLKNESGDFKTCEDEINETGCRYYMTEPNCHDCNQLDVGTVFSGNWHFAVCSDYAYYKDDYTPYESLICEINCEIPFGYRFDPYNVIFECIDNDVCGDNVTVDKQQLSAIDSAIENSDYEVITTSDLKGDYKSVVNIKCNNNYHPRLAFFNIDIFDYKIWLFVIVIYVMFMFLSHIKKH
jgi:hypothetical protein